MSVDKTPTGVVYTVTNGAAGQQYPLTFPYINGVDIKAYYVLNGTQNVLTYGVHYAVASQTFTSSIALPLGAKLAIYRQTDLTQEILWKDGQAVYTPDIMKADDKLTLIAQEISADMSRTVKLTREEEAAGGKPEDVVASIYASRDAAATSASAASVKATAAEASAQAAANSASTAAQTVATAAAEAVSAATVQANAAHDSALAAAQSAAESEAASNGLAPRMDAVELVAANAKAVTDLATTTPGAGKIPKAGSGGKIPDWAFDVGDLVPSFSTAKSGFLLCNGGAYSRTTYAALFAILGTSFGAGDGSTTFNAPDFRGRTFQGANANLKAVLAAGLPNITGNSLGVQAVAGPAYAGALYPFSSAGATFGSNSGGGWTSIGLDASRSSSIYGASTTVQSPAIAANIFIKY